MQIIAVELALIFKVPTAKLAAVHRLHVGLQGLKLSLSIGAVLQSGEWELKRDCWKWEWLRWRYIDQQGRGR